MANGGDDIARGRGGNDGFDFGDQLTPADRVFGGAGFDSLSIGVLEGNEITFAANSLDSIEILYLAEFASYHITFDDANIAAGKGLIIDAGNLNTTHNLTLNGFAETDGFFDIGGSSNDDFIATGAGNDIINSGGGNDSIDPGHGRDTVNGGTGSETIVFQFGGFDPTDHIDGGDTVNQNSIYLSEDLPDFVFKASTITNITQLVLNGGHSYSFDLTHATLRDNFTFFVRGENLGAHDTLHVDGSKIDNTGLTLVGGAGDDLLTGGTHTDFITGNGGVDILDGGKGAGHDVYDFQFVSDSTGRRYDTIVGFDAQLEFLFPEFTANSGHVSAVDPTVNDGKLSTAHFNADLAAAVGVGQLGIDHAVLFAPDSGGLAGKLFLIIDGNGQAGYQADADLVVLLQSAKHMNEFDAGNFGTAG